MHHETASLLEPLGVTEFEERIYGIVLDHPGASVVEISRAAGVGQRRASGGLASLEARGLVSRSAAPSRGFLPAPPDIALDVLMLRREEALKRARLNTALFVHRYRRAAPAAMGDLLEVVSGEAAVAQRFRQLLAAVTRELLAFDKMPYAVSPEEANSAELELLRRGVVIRGVYDEDVVSVPGATASIAALVDAGEQARLLANVPTKLAICDRRLALMPLRVGRPGIDSALVVHESALLDALVELFERLWVAATPLGFGVDAAPDRTSLLIPLDERVITLLAAGFAEQAIAVQLGVSPRTVGRRVERLMELLGARSRFQLGARINAKGWLDNG